MYNVANTSNRTLGLPHIGTIRPNEVKQVPDAVVRKLKGIRIVRVWAKRKWIRARKVSVDITPRMRAKMKRDKIASRDPDIDYTRNPNRPEKIRLINRLAKLGIIQSTRTSENKLRQLLQSAEEN